MKGLLKAGTIMMVAAMLSSCIVHEHHGRRGIPPGHAKKTYFYKKKGNGHYKGRGHGHHHHRH